MSPYSIYVMCSVQPREALRKWDWNLRRMGSGRKRARRISGPLYAQGDIAFIDLIICTPLPSWKKYAILSLSHSLDTDNGQQTRERSWWEVAPCSHCVCVCVFVCVSTYFYQHLTLSPEQPCHYGAFPAYTGQLSHHEISRGPQQERPVILPFPLGYYGNTVFLHQHLLIRQTWHIHLRIGERNPIQLVFWGMIKHTSSPDSPHSHADSLQLSPGHMQSTLKHFSQQIAGFGSSLLFLAFI